MLLDGIITLLSNTSGVSTLVTPNGGTAQIYKSVLPRGYSLPAIAIHRYGGTKDYKFDGPATTREDQVQIDCYAEDAETAQLVSEAVRVVLCPYVGTLPDGTAVQGCFLERDMDMPFLPHADTKGIASRALLGFRVVSVSAS